MRKSTLALLILAISLPTAPLAAAQMKAAAVEAAEAEALLKVVSVDRKARTVAAQTPAGAVVTIHVPPEAQNLDQVKPGDVFRMRYAESLAVSLHKGGSASAAGLQTVEVARKGATPGGRMQNVSEVTATVAALDRAARTMTLQGPRKNAVVVKVAPEVSSFDDVALGDTITVRYIEALALEMVRESDRARGATGR
jgi:hypothetical protein